MYIAMGPSDHRFKPGIKTNLSISVDVLSYFITLAESWLTSRCQGGTAFKTVLGKEREESLSSVSCRSKVQHSLTWCCMPIISVLEKWKGDHEFEASLSCPARCYLNMCWLCVALHEVPSLEAIINALLILAYKGVCVICSAWSVWFTISSWSYNLPPPPRSLFLFPEPLKHPAVFCW